jgi:hypothetical protein
MKGVAIRWGDFDGRFWMFRCHEPLKTQKAAEDGENGAKTYVIPAAFQANAILNV